MVSTQMDLGIDLSGFGHFLRFISVYRNMTSQIESWKKNIHRKVKKEKSQEVINSLARDESFLELETDRN